MNEPAVESNSQRFEFKIYIFIYIYTPTPYNGKCIFCHLFGQSDSIKMS